ncbi:MAG: YeeE/YedE family protein [Candidatus Accumulibacter sp.]|nr:YeeE/YedE family protein [Candidatus Accumulibacter conexus]
MSVLISLLIGLVFGCGLIVSGMGNPAKVLAFLDLAGDWDPSLALVMTGAIAVGLAAFRIAGRLPTSLRGKPLQMPTARQIDRRLLVGSALFGIGWGLAGICPGPALVLLGTGAAKGFVFVLAMLAGMAIFTAFERLSRARQAQSDAGK